MASDTDAPRAKASPASNPNKAPLAVKDAPPRHDGDSDHAIYITGSAEHGFADYMRDTPPDEVAGFFERVGQFLDVERGLSDYHFKVQDCRGRGRGWQVSVFYDPDNAAERTGPVAASRCMSCDMECPLSMGVTGSDDGGPVSRDTLIFEEAEMRCWLDAKARPVIIVTPKRHVRRMSELHRTELIALWQAAKRAMRELSPSGMFKSVVINHGTNQNHAHMHLKVWLHDPDFQQGLLQRPELGAAIARLEEWAASLPAKFQGRWRLDRTKSSQKRKNCLPARGKTGQRGTEKQPRNRQAR